MSSAERTSVAVVIPCFQQAAFLAEAIESAIAQNTAADEIIVVDDGGAENLTAIVSRYPAARLLRQENRGLAGARNSGLREAISDKILFLDADDMLLPSAISEGLECFGAHPDVAFVYGGFEEAGPDGTRNHPARPADRLDLLRCNWVAMIGAVMFDRAKLLGVGGFDESLGMCEDWDVYLRLSRAHAFAAHEAIVATYRRHGGGMSADVPSLRRWIDEVRSREMARGLSTIEARAWREGEKVWDFYYGATQPSRVKRAARMVSRALLGG